MMDKTEARHRMKDLACAASLARDAAESAPEAAAPEAAAPEGPTVVHTPYGKALVHVDGEGADVELPSGATVHVRFGG
jgi:hypothetical protein